MEKVGRLKLTNYWNKRVDGKFPHSAQAVLHPKKNEERNPVAASSCGEGSCNCGGGCNGECATSCEG